MGTKIVADQKVNTGAVLDTLEYADERLQRLHRMADATRSAIEALLKGPDGIEMRMSIADLVAMLAEESFSAMNAVNSMSEDFQATHTDTKWSDLHGAVCAAVHQGRSHA